MPHDYSAIGESLLRELTGGGAGGRGEAPRAAPAGKVRHSITRRHIADQLRREVERLQERG